MNGTFTEFMRSVNYWIGRTTHGEVTTYLDIPDFDYWLAWDAGESSQRTATNALSNAGFNN